MISFKRGAYKKTVASIGLEIHYRKVPCSSNAPEFNATSKVRCTNKPKCITQHANKHHNRFRNEAFFYLPNFIEK